ncbi:hypothetical protein CEXT_111431 [Caerostris extrusa]|uniref:Uncharacterized protein n=1 Tax=Caerostris extrusa TaxID=172846 RepID=A0AAV4S9Z1_CAEEX|nr:hypothetical protein CEXT_111431 [Caerostris extrusa]
MDGRISRNPNGTEKPFICEEEPSSGRSSKRHSLSVKQMAARFLEAFTPRKLLFFRGAPLSYDVDKQPGLRPWVHPSARRWGGKLIFCINAFPNLLREISGSPIYFSSAMDFLRAVNYEMLECRRSY